MAAEAANGTLFNGDQNVMMGGEIADKFFIEWFTKTRIGDGG